MSIEIKITLFHSELPKEFGVKNLYGKNSQKKISDAINKKYKGNFDITGMNVSSNICDSEPRIEITACHYSACRVPKPKKTR